MTNSKTVALFPGQGSQITGMGKAWYETSSDAKEIFYMADKVLGFSLSTLCFEGPEAELTLTKNAQPALLLVSWLNFKLSGITVDAAAGHSLGEYSALLAAGVLNFEDAILLVHKRGIYMQEAVPVGHGAMSAVMGPTETEISQFIEEAKNNNPEITLVEIANINSPGQIVIAGEAKSVSIFNDYLSQKGAKVIPLKVSAPFHSSLMKEAEISLSRDLDQISFDNPKIPVYSNFTAKKISSGSEARELLKAQVCGTVRWSDQIKNLVEENNIIRSIEFGPGGVLSKLLKRTIPEITRFEVSDPSSLEKVKSAF
ncbi:MAG TPA: ACP S-malonyltransferase [Oligoflexia bacterium]|nr:ACP S-malonyltransferase [Oligoflexia bacterium]HMP47434.1 ACP S-malonyltransferase [Oligoflexia bacterium]